MFAAFAALTSFVTSVSLKIPSPNASTHHARNSLVDARACGATPRVTTIAKTKANANPRRMTTLQRRDAAMVRGQRAHRNRKRSASRTHGRLEFARDGTPRRHPRTERKGDHGDSAALPVGAARHPGYRALSALPFVHADRATARRGGWRSLRPVDDLDSRQVDPLEREVVRADGSAHHHQAGGPQSHAGSAAPRSYAGREHLASVPAFDDPRLRRAAPRVRRRARAGASRGRDARAGDDRIDEA